MLYTQYTGFYGVYLIYGMDYGMEYQLTKIAT